MAYKAFAKYYDGLTENIDYEQKADYIIGIFSRYGVTSGKVLDLACGTGTLTLALSCRGMDMMGVDGAEEMLVQARQKADCAGRDILFIHQKMQSLDLPGKVDACVCTLDSLNHLKGESEIRCAFENISRYMRIGGLFVFDVNTVYKHREILGNNTFVYDTEDVYLVWQNTLRESDNSVLIELDFFEPMDNGLYRRSRDRFREYAYPEIDIRKMLSDYGFSTEGVFHETTFELPHDNSQRLTFAARKI